MSGRKESGHISESGFRKMAFKERYRVLRERGEHISYRYFGGYQVHLYLLDGLYVEVWTYVALRQILWIEPLRNEEAWKEYIDDLHLPDDLKK